MRQMPQDIPHQAIPLVIQNPVACLRIKDRLAQFERFKYAKKSEGNGFVVDPVKQR
jgi:hypothetical protein